MADKAKHAYGSRKNLDVALATGTVDAYDLLFLNGEGETPAIGWVDKNGNPIVLSPTDDLAKLEAQMETELASKVSTEAMANIEIQIASKIDATAVDTKIEQAVSDSIQLANSYTDGKVEAAINEHIVKKYKITSLPEGSLVKMSESEIRVMCPSNSVWTKQSVGTGGDPNCYYMTFTTYCYDDKVTGYIEHVGDQFDSEIQTTFSTDEYGRRFQQTWLALAKYDEATATWSYYGQNSSSEKFVGWDYQIDWYVDNVMVASDSIRINLSNEQCHSFLEPYYVGSIMKEVDTKIEERLSEVEASYEIVEF